MSRHTVLQGAAGAPFPVVRLPAAAWPDKTFNGAHAGLVRCPPPPQAPTEGSDLRSAGPVSRPGRTERPSPPKRGLLWRRGRAALPPPSDRGRWHVSCPSPGGAGPSGGRRGEAPRPARPRRPRRLKPPCPRQRGYGRRLLRAAPGSCEWPCRERRPPRAPRRVRPAAGCELQLPAGAARGGPASAGREHARRRRGRLSKAGCDWLRAAAGRGTRSDGRSGANGGEMVPGPVPRAAIIPARRKRRRRRRRRGS